MKDVKSSLSFKDLLDKDFNSSSSGNAAEVLNIRGRSVQRQTRPSHRSKSSQCGKFCVYCKKKGHTRENCFKFQKRLKDQESAKIDHG